MPGFPLAAFGAGLGQFAEYQQKQQAAQQRQQLLGLEMLRFRTRAEPSQCLHHRRARRWRQGLAAASEALPIRG